MPWIKLRLLMYFTFFSSSLRIFSVVALSRTTSWSARPRLFTSSMLRSDSVVEPAKAVVSATITFWMFLIRPLNAQLSVPSSGTVARNAGTMTQCTENA